MRLVKDSKSYSATFESWSEFLAFGQDAPVAPQFIGEGKTQHSRKVEDTRYRQWYGSEDFPASLKLAEEGWDEGTAKVKAAVLRDFTAVSDKIERPHYVYDVEGSDVDVARYLSGEPEVWLHEEVRITEGPGRRVFDLVVNCAVSSGVSAETIMQRGAAIVALIQAMELAGHGVSLTLQARIKSWASESGRIEVPLKTADQPVDLPRLAFALVHPSAFRRHIFAAMERLPLTNELNVGPHGNYGQPDEGKAEGAQLYFGGAHLRSRDWSNPKVVDAWIVSTLKEQGITLREGV